MAKIKYYDGYWSAKQPIPQEAILIRDQMTKDGAGIKGADLIILKAGTKLLLDMAENALGWTRFISVNGKLPALISNQTSKPEPEREGWADNSSFKLITVTEPGPTGKKKVYKITIEEVEE